MNHHQATQQTSSGMQSRIPGFFLRRGCSWMPQDENGAAMANFLTKHGETCGYYRFQWKIMEKCPVCSPFVHQAQTSYQVRPPKKNVAISGGNNQKHCHWEKEYVDDCEGLSAREIKPIWLPRDHHIKLTHFEQWVRPCNFFDMSKWAYEFIPLNWKLNADVWEVKMGHALPVGRAERVAVTYTVEVCQVTAPVRKHQHFEATLRVNTVA